MVWPTKSKLKSLHELCIRTDDGNHELFVAHAGNPQGIPAVFLHGGPGSGCQSSHLELFDLSQFWVILPDQRGAGRSTPKTSFTSNTTAHLISYLEQIRKKLGISNLSRLKIEKYFFIIFCM